MAPSAKRAKRTESAKQAKGTEMERQARGTDNFVWPVPATVSHDAHGHEVIRPARSPYVKVRGSAVHGRGLFAARDIPKGTLILQYGGVKVPKKEGWRRTAKQWATGRVYTFELSTRFDLDGSPPWNIARLINHSCQPNCESDNVRGREIWIKALRTIKAGEELGYDYNFPVEEDMLVCKCGAPKCRGYVVGSGQTRQLKAMLRKLGKE